MLQHLRPQLRIVRYGMALPQRTCSRRSRFECMQCTCCVIMNVSMRGYKLRSCQQAFLQGSVGSLRSQEAQQVAILARLHLAPETWCCAGNAGGPGRWIWVCFVRPGMS